MGVGVIALALGFSGFVIPFRHYLDFGYGMCGHDTVFVLCGFERACHALFLYRVVCVGFHGVLFIRPITC